MNTYHKVNYPAGSTAQKLINKLKNIKGLDLKLEPNGQYRCNSPLREGSNSHAFSITLKDGGEHGAYKDFVTDEEGSLYELAEKLGIETPKTDSFDDKGYANLEDYATRHGVDVEVFQRAGWRDGRWCGARALEFDTPNGKRFRLLESDSKNKYQQAKGYTPCWYRLDEARRIAQATGQPLVICNGEASVVVAQHNEIAATCQNMGETKRFTPENLEQLKAQYSGPIIVALDCDPTGYTQAPKRVEELQAAGFDARAVDLLGSNGFDLADFAWLHGKDSAATLQNLPELGADDEDTPPAPVANVYVPPLPAAATLPEDLGQDACPWLDEAIRFSREWSPRSYDDYHEACALFALSTIAARRVVLHLGKKRYPNLYINLVGRTSLWAKSSAADTFIDMLRAAGLSFLLAPDESTPQALIKDMAGHVPQDFDELPDEKQTRIRQRLAFAAQRGWYYDEFGQKLSAMMREGSAMADFRGLLRRLDDCKESYESITIGRVADELKAPYLALLANMTPADMVPHARRNGALWGDGFFARMAFVCPPPDAKPQSGRFPTGERNIPPSLIIPLVRWHERLGVPQVRMQERTNAKGEGTGVYDAEVDPLPTTTVTLGLGVFDAFYRYDEALRELAQANEHTDLDGNYARLAEKAMRVAMLLASLSNNNVIEMRHWARAQQIAERWRRSLHNLIETVQGQQEATRESDLEDKVMRILERVGAATVNDIRKAHLRHTSTEELERILESLARNGRVTVETTRRKTKRYGVLPAQPSRTPNSANGVTVTTVNSVKDLNSYTIQTEPTNGVSKKEDLHHYTVTPLHHSDETLQKTTNGNGHTPESPPEQSNGRTAPAAESDVAHDNRRECEAKAYAEQGKWKRAFETADRIRGRKKGKEVKEWLEQKHQEASA